MKYLGAYDLFVDEDGTVYRKSRYNGRGRRKGGLYPMKTYIDKNGYRFVEWGDRRGTHCQRVHRLVALAFVPNPNGYETVDHIDRDRANNKAGNLRWADRKMQADNTVPVEVSVSLYGVRDCEDRAAYKKAWRKARKLAGKRYA